MIERTQIAKINLTEHEISWEVQAATLRTLKMA